MQKQSSIVQHPGEFIRESILNTQNITVTKAAGIIGVGRPAFSNFLNGNTSLSADMAARLERAFGVPAQKLHDLQTSYDAANAKGAPANTKAYVPPFLSIVANEIEAWSSSVNARARLAVFLRTLINCTGVGLTEVDFPGNDDSQRPGWDGFVVADEGTPWVPVGQSGWEFGCNEDPKTKANKDYKKSTEASNSLVRSQITFIFVTPRRWPGKKEWIKERKKENRWKDVRVYDASNLEQWLEQSIAGQTWFANETQRSTSNTRSLDQCWTDWSLSADPPLTGALFETAVTEAQETIESKLSKPPEEPIIIAADSTEEAVAFLAQLFNVNAAKLVRFRDRVVIFDKPGVLPKLAANPANSSKFIAVVTTREVERELAPFCRSLHAIVVYPRNAINVEPDVLLEPLSYEAFHTSLEKGGYERDEINRLDNESGRSLTVLRRRLSKVLAVKTPEWASDHNVATGLIPMMFAGAWNSANRFDRDILSYLAKDLPFEDIEKRLQQLIVLNDAPVWSVGSYRGVISKIDCLYATKWIITRSDLDTYFDVADLVLSEDDPALDLPEEERLFASLRGKTREISGALRKGIRETLVLLAIHGNGLFQQKLGVNLEDKASQLVRKLLGNPLTTRTLEAHDHDLPTYAEVAPDEFLNIIERDLKLPNPALVGLMRPANSGIFSNCPRTGSLWALENLAWSPKTVRRTALILAKLAEIKIDDNWINKPISSLKGIFRSWLPQTAASVQQRIEIIELLAKRFPKIAWEICTAQFGQSDRTGSYNHKPCWRTDAYGFGKPVTDSEWHAFVVKMVDMALSWGSYDRSMLGDLVERLHEVDDSWQQTIWTIIKDWARTASDLDKAWVREKIRTTVMSKRGVARTQKAKVNQLQAIAKDAYIALEPAHILNRYEWLFRDAWVQESYDEIHSEDTDYEGREQRIADMRVYGIQEIIQECGIEGITKLAEMGKTPFQIGALLATRVLNISEVISFILSLVPSVKKEDLWTYKNLMMGALWAIEDDSTRTSMLCEIRDHLTSDNFVEVLKQAPFRSATWRLVEMMHETYRQAYWHEVVPSWSRQTEDELNDLVEQLLMAKRPRAAFQCVHFKLEKLRPMVLFRLLEGIATVGNEPQGHYQLDPYYLGEAFEILNASASFSVEQMAGLEFLYLDVLTQSSTGRTETSIINLEKYIDEHPDFFAQAVAWVYKRKDGEEDPEELMLTDSEQLRNRSMKGYQLIEGLSRIPGRNKQGDVDKYLLLKWTNTVRQKCAELGRQDVGDNSLGKLFAESPKGEDGIWPCEPVRYVLEQIQSESISDGITIGLFNSRGIHWRGEGGENERELASMYRKWSSPLEFSSPFVASTILMQMAERYERDAQDEDRAAMIRRRLR